MTRWAGASRDAITQPIPRLGRHRLDGPSPTLALSRRCFHHRHAISIPRDDYVDLSGCPIPDQECKGKVKEAYGLAYQHFLDTSDAGTSQSGSAAGETPAYRAVLDLDGVQSPADICLVGDEDNVAAQLQRFADVGATELTALPFGDAATQTRTSELLAGIGLVA
ncbi:MAG TPA: hypothetical protein VH166_08610 [Mycobacterium sp.]|nr:hypothetical protein [Mycobacterium sp.]